MRLEELWAYETNADWAPCSKVVSFNAVSLSACATVGLWRGRRGSCYATYVRGSDCLFSPASLLTTWYMSVLGINRTHHLTTYLLYYQDCLSLGIYLGISSRLCQAGVLFPRLLADSHLSCFTESLTLPEQIKHAEYWMP